MKVLIACEESQEVCKAFRELGHEAFSCDILSCSGGHPEWHIKDDVLKVIKTGRCNLENGDILFIYKWDLLIAHPPCTRLCNSGVCWLKSRDLTKEMEDGALFFKKLLDVDIPLKCIENPIPHKYALAIIGRKYDQIIQPYMFGHPERKATCLWLVGLPKLKPTRNVKEKMLKLPKSKSQRIHYTSPGKDRAMIRSKTFPGIAKAIAKQYGAFNGGTGK